MEGFETMCKDHLGRLSIAKKQVELIPGQEKPVYSAPYQAGLKAREFGKSVTDKLLKLKVAEQDKTDWTATIVFAQKKDGSIRFHVDYHK